jgi:3',5'-cyclic AMP phosphodiesterase CpdA
MKIIHLSDFHLSTVFRDSNLDKIKFLFDKIHELEWDHIVVTGDLTDNADANDFKILRNIFESYNLLDPQKLSLVIGNHDIFGGIQTAEDILTFPEKCRVTDYDLRICEFAEYFKETFSNCVYNSENIFPYAKLIDDVLIIGMNTIARYSKLKNPFASNGEVDLQQFTELDDILQLFGHLAKSKIILTHHHFSKIKAAIPGSTTGIWQNIEKQTMKLRKKKRLLKFFNRYNVDLVMHGHLHENKVYTRKGINFINAGASVKGNGAKLVRINSIDTITGVVNIFVYNTETSEFINIIPVINSEDPAAMPAAVFFN